MISWFPKVCFFKCKLSRYGEAMFPFQREGVKYGLARGGRVLIGDQMGLGGGCESLHKLRWYPERL